MEVDLRKVTVLPKDKWEKIKARLEPRSVEDARLLERIEERERLHQKSIEVVKNWPNTIQGQRQRKLEARKLRLEAEEKELQRIDKEEAIFQQAKRRAAIDKAKTLQYYQTDRVKKFHGAMVLSEVLKERDAQLEMRKHISEMQRQREAKFDSMYENKYKQMEENEKKRHQNALEKTLKVADYQRKQVKATQEKLMEEVRQDIDLGKQLNQQDNEYKTWLRNKNEQERMSKRQLMHDVIDQMSQKQRIKELEKEQRREEDIEIELFDRAKDAMLKERKNRAQVLLKNQQNQRLRMVEKLDGVYEHANDQENQRIVQRQLEDEERAKREDQRKKEKNLRQIAEIKKHRQAEEIRLKDITEKEKMENEVDLKNRIEIDNVYMETQKQKVREQRSRAVGLKMQHILQINERAAGERIRLDNDLKNDKAKEKALQIEEEEFQKYAGEVISLAKAGNANCFPLLKAARPGAGGGHGPMDKGGVRPSFLSNDGYRVELPTYQQNSTEAVKKFYAPKDMVHAKKRFGFVW